MKTRMILTILIGGLAMSLSSLCAQSKIGFADSQKILGALKETQDVQAKLQAEQENLYKQYQYLQDSLENAQEDYVKNVKDNPLLKDGTKKSIEKGIQELAYLVQTSGQKFSEDLQKKQQELMQPILDRVKKAVENIRKSEGLDYVFDSSFGIILASDQKYDMTQKTLDELVKMGETKDTGKKETKDDTKKP